MSSKKAEITRARILEAALSVFRERGFDAATMRDIAAEADVALGAAYYYFPSKDAIVLAFYEQAQEEMQVSLAEVLKVSKTFQQRVGGIINCKLAYFEGNRKLLGTLSAYADPEQALSPFSRQTLAIREKDIAFFEEAVQASKLKLPASLKPYLPRLLWLYQMGLILFWIYDHSPKQARTRIVMEKTLKMMDWGLRFAGLPLFRPVHKLSAELLAAVYGEEGVAKK